MLYAHTMMAPAQFNHPILHPVPQAFESILPTRCVPTDVKPRRGRRSAVPVELRDQTRRLKKQNMERRRRASISDKMTALHNVAMDLVGLDPCAHPKVEKADILNMCHKLFEGIAKIARENPEVQSRLYGLRAQLPSASPLMTRSNLREQRQDATHSSGTADENPSEWKSSKANDLEVVPSHLKVDPRSSQCDSGLGTSRFKRIAAFSSPGWHSATVAHPELVNRRLTTAQPKAPARTPLGSRSNLTATASLEQERTQKLYHPSAFQTVTSKSSQVWRPYL